MYIVWSFYNVGEKSVLEQLHPYVRTIFVFSLQTTSNQALFACDEGSADCLQLFSRSSVPLSAQPQQSPARGGLSAGAVLYLSGAIGELHSN